MGFIAYIFVFFNLSALGAAITEKDCTPVDTSTLFGPIRDQGVTQFCYSFSAADIMGEALNVKPPQQLSAFYFVSQYVSMKPADVAKANAILESDYPKQEAVSPPSAASSGFGSGVSYRSTNPQSILSSTFTPRLHKPEGKPLLKREGGQEDLLLAHLLSKNKFCTEQEVPSEKKLDGKDTSNPQFFLVRMGEWAGGAQIETFLKEKKSGSVDPSCPLSVLDKSGQSLIELKAKIQDYAAETLRTQTEAKCSLPENASKLKIHSRDFAPFRPSKDAFKAYAMNALDKGRPFALSYNPCILTRCKDDDPEALAHASVVTGRIWDTKKNRCMLQIRNSYGTSCENKASDVECKDGVWSVDINELPKNNWTGVTWIEK